MSSEKTEQPTAKKLRDARQRGQVARSKDFTQTVLVVALFGYVIAAGGGIGQRLAALLMLPMDFVSTPFDETLETVGYAVLREAVSLMLPFLLIVLVAGILSETLQVGILFAFSAIKPSAKKLNIAQNAKNMVSKKNLVEFAKNCLKVTFLSALLYTVVRDELGLLPALPRGGFETIGVAVGVLMKALVIKVALAYTVISLADLGWQRYSHKKELMMSRDEVKREYKESEGDPHIKGARKHLHQELMTSGMVENTRNASVVVTNPTHVAVALYYDDETTPLPIVVAKGTDILAQRIVAVAHEEGIPVMQNIRLARALMAEAPLDHYIPTDYIEPVAEILRIVRRLAEQPKD